jgi:predicted nucleic acid-binding protein
MKLSGRIFNIALPRGSQWMDIELNVPVEALLELVEKRLSKTKKKTTTERKNAK